MTLKVLLINIHSFNNVGDAALSQVAIDQIQENFPDSRLTLVMNDPQSYTGNEQVVLSFHTWVTKNINHQAVRFIWLVCVSLVASITNRLFGKAIFFPISRDIRATIQAYLEANLVVSVPGGYFYSYGRGRALINIAFSMSLAHFSGQPLYLFPQSFGPLQFQWEHWLAGWLLSHSRLVMAREAQSYEQLANWGIPISKCHILPDSAFAYKGDPPDYALNWLHSQGINPQTDRPMLGITMLDWGAQYPGFQNQEAYENAIAAAIKYFIAQLGGRVLLLPQSCGPTPAEDDRLPASRVAKRVSHLGTSVFQAILPLSPGLLYSVYGQLDLLIGTRMHSNIFALSQGVPVIAIGYLHKTLGIAQSAGIKDWVVDIQQINEACLIEKLSDLWSVRSKIREDLRGRMPAIQQKSREAGRLTALDYTRLIERN